MLKEALQTKDKNDTKWISGATKRSDIIKRKHEKMQNTFFFLFLKSL
jgi:hypothetical protein